MATVALERRSVSIWTVPIGLCLLMLACATAIQWRGGHAWWPPVPRYLLASLTVCASVAAIWIVAQAAAVLKTERPLLALWGRAKPRLPYLALPAFVLPLFLAGYTACKASIQPMVGFRYDALFASADYAIFGIDPWRLTHAAIGWRGSQFVEVVYVGLWVAVLGYSKALVALFAKPRTIATFYIGMMLTWFVGGFLGAYLLSSAGPVFTDLNGLEWHFAELKMRLVELYGPTSTFVKETGYLESTLQPGVTTFDGGGISAMPSMHIAACSIYVLASKGTRWFWPAVVFLGLIWVGSVHSGFHYAVDGPVAFLIALGCWKLAQKIVEGLGDAVE